MGLWQRKYEIKLLRYVYVCRTGRQRFRLHTRAPRWGWFRACCLTLTQTMALWPVSQLGAANWVLAPYLNRCSASTAPAAAAGLQSEVHCALRLPRLATAAVVAAATIDPATSAARAARIQDSDEERHALIKPARSYTAATEHAADDS